MRLKKLQQKLIFLMATKFALIMHYEYYEQAAMDTSLTLQGEARKESPYLTPLGVVNGFEQLG